MDLYEAIEKRRSIVDLSSLLQQTLRRLCWQAPRAVRSQYAPWEFIVIDDPR